MQKLSYRIGCFLQKGAYLKQLNQYRKRCNILAAKVKKDLIIP